MSNVGKFKPRLTRQDWVHTALDQLIEAGIGSVSIDQVAGSLSITRGSFYHHFSDRHELLREVLEYWAQRWTYDVRDQIAVLGLDPSTTLLALMRAIRKNRAAGYDAPIRAWALHDPLAADVVRQVDEVRLSFIQTQFEALGFTDLDAQNRAQLFLYYEIAAPAMFTTTSSELEEQLLVERHHFLTTTKN